MEVVYKNIDWVEPYKDNPRKISQKAIDGVAESLKQFGWEQPIVTDKKGVIIVGHTRYYAARKLAYSEVPVAIADLPEKEANEYRIVDNSSSEKSEWDIDKLFDELSEIEKGTYTGFNFDEIEESVGKMLDEVDRKVDDKKEKKKQDETNDSYKLVSYDAESINKAHEYLSEVIGKYAEITEHK